MELCSKAFQISDEKLCCMWVASIVNEVRLNVEYEFHSRIGRSFIVESNANNDATESLECRDDIQEQFLVPGSSQNISIIYMFDVKAIANTVYNHTNAYDFVLADGFATIYLNANFLASQKLLELFKGLYILDDDRFADTRASHSDCAFQYLFKMLAAAQRKRQRGMVDE